MIKKITALLLSGTVAIAISACNTSSDTTKKVKEIEQSSITDEHSIFFRVAENYFVKNTITESVPSKITTQKEFNKYFGMGTAMGDGGKPTPIDFAKEYVIVVDYKDINKKTEIKPLRLAKVGANVTLTYRLTEGQDLGFTTHPFLMIIVNKDNDGAVILQKQ